MFNTKGFIVFISIVSVVLLSGCPGGKVVVKKVSDASSSKSGKINGVFYALPKTVIKAAVPVKKTDSKLGEFQDISPCFFSLDQIKGNAINDEGTAVGVGAATFSTRGTPDRSEIYVVQIKDNAFLRNLFVTKTIKADFSESGMLTKAEAESKDQTIEFVAKAGKAIITTAVKAAGVGSGMSNFKTNSTIKGTEHGWTDSSEDDRKAAEDRVKACKLKLADAIKYAQAYEIEGAFLEKLKKAYAAVPSAFAAKADADNSEFLKRLDAAGVLYSRLHVLKTQREDLVSGEKMPAGLSKETLDKMLTELDATIRNYEKQNFLGTQTKSEWVGNFEITPRNHNLTRTTPNAVETYDLFEFAPDAGVCKKPNDELTKQGISVGSEVSPSKENKYKCDGTRLSKVRITTDREYGQFADEVYRSFPNPPRGSRGFSYRIPGTATVMLQLGTFPKVEKGKPDEPIKFSEKSRGTLILAQMGMTVSLPSSASGRSTKYALELYEASGALKNFSMGSDSLIEKSLVEDAQSTADAIIDSQDDLKKLERKRKILEELNKIREAEEKMEKDKP